MEESAYRSPEIIERLGKVLRLPVPRASEDLEEHLVLLDSLRVDLATAACDHMRLLHEKRKQMLWPKDFDKKMTELDRTTRLNGDVAIIERDYRLLERIEGILEGRMALALSLLNR